MALKWIINDGKLVMGNVKLHEDLLWGTTMERKKTTGGGYWHFDRRKNKLYIYSKSQDFGSVSKEAFFKALEESELPRHIYPNAKVIFSNLESLSDVFKYDDIEDSNNNQ